MHKNNTDPPSEGLEEKGGTDLRWLGLALPAVGEIVGSKLLLIQAAQLAAQAAADEPAGSPGNAAQAPGEPSQVLDLVEDDQVRILPAEGEGGEEFGHLALFLPQLFTLHLHHPALFGNGEEIGKDKLVLAAELDALILPKGRMESKPFEPCNLFGGDVDPLCEIEHREPGARIVLEQVSGEMVEVDRGQPVHGSHETHGELAGDAPQERPRWDGVIRRDVA